MYGRVGLLRLNFFWKMSILAYEANGVTSLKLHFFSDLKALWCWLSCNCRPALLKIFRNTKNSFFWPCNALVYLKNKKISIFFFCIFPKKMIFKIKYHEWYFNIRLHTNDEKVFLGRKIFGLELYCIVLQCLF